MRNVKWQQKVKLDRKWEVHRTCLIPEIGSIHRWITIVRALRGHNQEVVQPPKIQWGLRFQRTLSQTFDPNERSHFRRAAQFIPLLLPKRGFRRDFLGRLWNNRLYTRTIWLDNLAEQANQRRIQNGKHPPYYYCLIPILLESTLWTKWEWEK